MRAPLSPFTEEIVSDIPTLGAFEFSSNMAILLEFSSCRMRIPRENDKSKRGSWA